MKLRDIIKYTEAILYSSIDNFDEHREIQCAFSSDLMSDVLAFVNCNLLLITGLSNPQTIRTAEMLDVETILYVRNKKPSEFEIKLANDNNITLLSTPLMMYQVCGILYCSGLKSIRKDE